MIVQNLLDVCWILTAFVLGALVFQGLSERVSRALGILRQQEDQGGRQAEEGQDKR